MDRPLAAVAITRHGTELARRLGREWHDLDLYYPAKFAHGDEEIRGIHLFEVPVRSLLGDLFGRYRGLVLFISLGAVVRMLAPLLQDKHSDPGVVVVDDLGEHAISVLSGHLGGANALARAVAGALGARPVITTASDVQKTVAVDLLGREFGWEIENPQEITPVSAAVVNGERIAVIQEAGEPHWWPATAPFPGNIRVYPSPTEALREGFDAALVITPRLLGPEETASLLNRGVLYRPRTVVLGIGCNRGTSREELEAMVHETLAELGLSLRSVRNVATIDLKGDEPGLVALCDRHGWRLETFPPEALNRMPMRHPSETVHRYTGAYGVSEPAAMLSAGTDRLLLEKRKSGNVTMAVALVSFGGREAPHP